MEEKLGGVERKYRKLQEIASKFDRVLVAFSGGVDSTFLLKVCRDVLGDNVLAVTARSATTARREINDALQVARLLGAEHIIVESGELGLEEFVSNPAEKCYICKKSRFVDLAKLANERGCGAILEGENADDHDDYRPGSRATRELGVRSPLREAGLTKEEIRSLSKELDLPTWNKPAYACLATRIPYGEPITEKKLRQVDSAEEFLRDLLLAVQIRVRHHGSVARIEVEPGAIRDLTEPDNRESITQFFKELGFVHVALDLEGYTMGSLNRSLEATGSEERIQSPMRH